MQHTFHSLSIIDNILLSIDEKDDRRSLLYQLRLQLQEDEVTFEEARNTIVELEGALEKVTAPANRVGTLLELSKNGVACICVGGSEYYVNLDSRLDQTNLSVGTRVLVNEAFAVVGDLGYPFSGAVAKISDVLEDGRLRVGQEHGLQSAILVRGSKLLDVDIKVGEEVRVDLNFRVVLERISNQGGSDFYLEEIPKLPWEKIGGQKEAIRAIKETIEMPVLYPELFHRFQYRMPKGFLLYGPPGCGKTLIGKATAYNLAQKVQQEAGLKLKECFMHIKGPEILNMWVGETERQIREIFAQAREKRKEGHLPVIFIDEAESILGTRRAVRSHNISNTIVPMFCSEMDGIESLQDIVIILASNRPDLIDPALLRSGRIDRKIKVTRPDAKGAREIFKIYLTSDLPISLVEDGSQGEDVKAAVNFLVARTTEAVFSKREGSKFLEVTLRSGRKEVLYRGDLCSGAVLESIVQRAKELAIRRSIESGVEEGIRLKDMLEAVETEYVENEIFPATDNTEDWLKLLDYDPENVVRATPIRSKTENENRKEGIGVI